MNSPSVVQLISRRLSENVAIARCLNTLQQHPGVAFRACCHACAQHRRARARQLCGAVAWRCAGGPVLVSLPRHVVRESRRSVFNPVFNGDPRAVLVRKRAVGGARQGLLTNRAPPPSGPSRGGPETGGWIEAISNECKGRASHENPRSRRRIAEAKFSPREYVRRETRRCPNPGQCQSVRIN